MKIVCFSKYRKKGLTFETDSLFISDDYFGFCVDDYCSIFYFNSFCFNFKTYIFDLDDNEYLDLFDYLSNLCSEVKKC